MRRKTGSSAIIAAGIFTVAAAVAFMAVNTAKSGGSDINTDSTVLKIEAAMPERSAGVQEDRTDNNMPVIEIDGVDFIGLLELPDRDIKLPVRAQWSGNLSCPERYMGSIYNGTLIVGGDYDADGFDFADRADAGERVTFTDMDGQVYALSIRRIRHMKEISADRLKNDDSTLTLFVKKDGAYLIIECIQ